MQRCASCGAENRDIARFCANCGQRLHEDVAAAAPEQVAAPQAEEPVLHAGLDGVLSEEQEQAPHGAWDVAAPDAEPSDVAVAAAPVGEPAAPWVTAGATGPDVGADQAAEGAANEVAADAPASETGEAAAAPEPAGEGAPGLSPLESGVVVAGRWQITGLQEAVEARNTYLALDLAACPACGSVFDPGEDYCSECGAQLAQAGQSPAVTLHEAGSPDALADFGPSLVQDGDRLYVAVAAGPAAPASPTEPQPLALTVGYATHCGLVRELDEDSLFVFTLAGLFESRVGPSLGLFIVADGMGGHEGGELASREAVNKVADSLIDSVLRRIFKRQFEGGADGMTKNVQRAVIDANTVVHQMAVKKGIDAGTTLTLAIVVDGEAYIANVGDSRTFLFRQGKLRQVTQDHSLVASLVLAGAIQPEEIYTHPQRNAVYRSLGTSPRVEVDQFYEQLQPGDALVLCCDGIWEAIRPEGIEEVMLAVPDPQAACNEMVRRSNAAGGEDNLSVIVVRAGA